MNGHTPLPEDDYTVVDNYFFDHVMPRVKAAEWKIICAVIRETFGWRCDDYKHGKSCRRFDAEISIDRFVALTGFNSQAVVRAIKKITNRTVVSRRVQQTGRQRTFRYRAVPKANLKVLEDPVTSPQEALPFVADGESHNPSDGMVKVTIPTSVPDGESHNPNVAVLRSIKESRSKEIHTQITRARKEPVEKSAAKPRVCASKFTKRRIRQYAWASHNFTKFINAYWDARGKKQHFVRGINNPEGWATEAKRTGEHDDEIQEWIEDPEMFDAVSWRRGQTA